MGIDLSQLDASGASNGDIIEFDGTDWVAVSAPFSPAYGSWYNSATENIGTTPGSLIFNSTHVAAVGITQSSATITFPTAGKYLISVDMSLDTTSASDAGVDIWLELNGTEITGTRSRAYHDATDEESACSCTIIVDLAADDEIELWADVFAGAAQDTLANSVRLNAHRIA